jgi:DNA-binding CsgD family transcriptional regulator
MILTAKSKMSEGGENSRSTLSQRELEVLGRIKDGMRTTDISETLSISERTVKFHIKNIKQKLNAVSRAHAVAIALERKLIDNVKHA